MEFSFDPTAVACIACRKNCVINIMRIFRVVSVDITPMLSCIIVYYLSYATARIQRIMCYPCCNSISVYTDCGI